MKYVLWWLYAAAGATLVLGVCYVAVQQMYRESLNDPQIQIVEDGSAALSTGAVPAELMPLVAGEPGARTPSVDMARSLAVWIVVYDSSGVPLESSATLDGAPPRLPPGVFDTTTWTKHSNGTFYNQGPVAETRFTWQPEAGIRQAVVLAETPDKKYFIAAGRNMREVEQRIEHEGELVFMGWLATLAALAVLQLLYVFGRGAARRYSR